MLLSITNGVNKSIIDVIFFLDGSDLFVTAKDINFYSVIGESSFTIPCRLTHPNATVRLLKGLRVMGRDVALGPNLIYDPKTGFTILSVTEFYHGWFTCKAELRNRASSQLLHLQYMG